MEHAPILVHRISASGGRRVVIGDSEVIAWQGGRPHVYAEPDDA